MSIQENNNSEKPQDDSRLKLFNIGFDLTTSDPYERDDVRYSSNDLLQSVLPYRKSDELVQ